MIIPAISMKIPTIILDTFFPLLPFPSCPWSFSFLPSAEILSLFSMSFVSSSSVSNGTLYSLLKHCKFSVDGLDVPVSHFVTACRDTSSSSDTSAWDSPSLFRKRANFLSKVIVYISKSIPVRNKSKPPAAYFPATNGCQLGFYPFFEVSMPRNVSSRCAAAHITLDF